MAQLLQNYLVEANIVLQEGANWLPFQKESEKTLKLRLAKLIARTFMHQAARLLNMAERWVLSMVNQDQLVRVIAIMLCMRPPQCLPQNIVGLFV